MALEFARTLDGSDGMQIQDFALDTWAVAAAGYNQGITGNSAAPKKGDLVYLSAGKLRRCADAAGQEPIGIIEGFEFVGLGGPATATNPVDNSAVNAAFTASVTDTTRYPNGVAKVRTANNAVYRIPVVTTAGLANVGIAYGITVAATGDQSLDLTETTNTVVKVVDYSKDGKTAYVVPVTNPTF
jgi:hypothetical protein